MALREATKTALSAHSTTDPVEAEHLRRMRKLAAVDGDPFSRSHFQPGHFTASAFVVTPDGTRVLLIKHKKLKRWLQPGGHIDQTDPDPLHAAMREVREETGLSALEPLGDGLLDVDVHAIPALGQEPPHEHFDLRFCFVTTDQGNDCSDEIDGLSWVALDKVTGMDTDASVRRAAARLREQLHSGVLALDCAE